MRAVIHLTPEGLKDSSYNWACVWALFAHRLDPIILGFLPKTRHVPFSRLSKHDVHFSVPEAGAFFVA